MQPGAGRRAMEAADTTTMPHSKNRHAEDILAGQDRRETFKEATT